MLVPDRKESHFGAYLFAFSRHKGLPKITKSLILQAIAESASSPRLNLNPEVNGAGIHFYPGYFIFLITIFGIPASSHFQEELPLLLFQRKVSVVQAHDDQAEKVGVSRQTINSIEKGQFIPSTLLALKIASVFGEQVDHIFRLEDSDWEK